MPKKKPNYDSESVSIKRQEKGVSKRRKLLRFFKNITECGLPFYDGEILAENLIMYLKFMGFYTLDYFENHILATVFYNLKYTRLFLKIIYHDKETDGKSYRSIVSFLRESLKSAVVEVRLRNLMSNLILLNIAARVEETMDDPKIPKLFEAITGKEMDYWKSIIDKDMGNYEFMYGFYYYISLVPVRGEDYSNRIIGDTDFLALDNYAKDRCKIDLFYLRNTFKGRARAIFNKDEVSLKNSAAQ